MSQKETGKGLVVDGVEIAPGVVETIISLAAGEVEGVAGVGAAGTISSIMSSFNAGKAIPTTGIEVRMGEDGKVSVSITLQAYYGHRIVDVASKVRSAVADALEGQIGAQVGSVDVHVDGLQFEE